MYMSLKQNPGWIKIHFKPELQQVIDESSHYFKHSFVTRLGSKKLIFLKQRHSDDVLKQAQNGLEHLLVSERIVRINNYLCTTYLPEIVDVYYSRLNETPRIHIVKQFFYGLQRSANLRDALSRGLFNIQSNDEGLALNLSNHLKAQKVKFKMFVERIIAQIIEFQKYLYSKGLVHTALEPTHIIILVDYIVKFVGERHIMRHLNGFLNDPSAINEEKYGSITIPRYSPNFFIEHVATGGTKPVNVIGLTSYQLGVLLFDFATLGTYGNIPFTKGLVEDVELYVSFAKEETLRSVILQLVDEGFCREVKDFSEIEKVFEIALID